jgi:ESCRT-I complex subunit TSG101
MPSPQINAQAHLEKLKNDLNVKTSNSLNEFTNKSNQEMEEMKREISTINNSRSKNDNLEREVAHYQGELARIDAAIREASAWLEQNTKHEVDVDAATEPKEPLIKQLLAIIAEDAAIEDMIYYLERALLKGSIDLETYLKEVRRLSREQFYKKALVSKIHQQLKVQ